MIYENKKLRIKEKFSDGLGTQTTAFTNANNEPLKYKVSYKK